MKRLIIAIDGPSGAGKGTVARAIAAALGYRHVDSGAMYRAVGWKSLRDGIALDDEQFVANVANRSQIEMVGINFLGASLGALEGAYLSVIDAEERKIGIERFLLVNPPLDLSYALAKVDEWDAFQNRFGRDKSKKLVAKALGIVESFSKDKRDDPKIFERFAKAFAGFTTEEIQFLIAEDMQALLPDLAYVTQGIHDPNARGASKAEARKRLQEAKALTFSDYSEKIALPLWRLQTAEPQADSERFWKRGSLAPILGRLRGYSPVQFMHNADDFIARSYAEAAEIRKAIYLETDPDIPVGKILDTLEDRAQKLRTALGDICG
jgi:hypothetical protein